MPFRSMFPVFLLGALAGCSGEYILTAADSVALPGEPAAVVVRLQRREFWFHCPPVRGAAITFRDQCGNLRCARTDKHGYAAVAIPAPESPGSYTVELHLQDSLGYTVSGRALIFVLDPGRPVVAVDADSLPAEVGPAQAAGKALARLARSAQVVYLSEALRGAPERARRRLSQMGCPSGPVIGWRHRPTLRRRLGGKSAGPGPLAMLKRRLPKLTCAVTANPAAAEALKRAGLKVCLVGARRQLDGVQQVASWAELALALLGKGG